MTGLCGRPRRWGAALVAVLCGSCGILSEAPKRQLYRADPTVNFAAPLPKTAAQLLVTVPNAPAGLDTARIALSRSAVSLDYFADAEWTDRAPLLVQSAIIESFEKSEAVPAVGRDNAGLRADFILQTDIRDFSAAYDSPTEPPLVSVVVHMELITIPEHRIVAQRSIARRQRAVANSVPEVVRAFDSALGGVVEEVVRWAVTNTALSGRRGSLSWPRFVHAG
jgi:cholesterol transport system auxiliary component